MAPRIAIAFLVGLAGLLTSNWANCQPVDSPAERPKSEAVQIAEDLASSDPEVQTATWNRVQEMLNRPIEYTVAGVPTVNVDPLWVVSLIKTNRYDEAANLAVTGILRYPVSAMSVAGLQKRRTEAFLAAGKREEALAAAKAFYNVCALAQTPQAVEYISTALTRARPDDAGLAERFKAEQAASASTQPAADAPANMSPATQPAASDILKSIPADSKPFEARLQELTGQDYQTHLARGNLLLLCDRSADARKAFDQALPLANAPKETAAANDGIARAIRAESGSVARAQEYLNSVQGGTP